MHTYLDCIPCFFKQALEAARIAGVSEKKRKQIVDEVARKLLSFSLRSTPPEMGRDVYRIVRSAAGAQDPYRRIKADSTRRALGLYAAARRKLARSRDRLLTATQLAIAGNVIDYGVKNTLNVEEELRRIMTEDHARASRNDSRQFAYAAFRAEVATAGTILYLGDNAGETVFDRLLLEEIKRIDPEKRIRYAVRGQPVINDAVREDALAAGIDAVAEIVSSGSDAPGTVLSLCSARFLAQYRSADMVISKGQGNFEALSRARRPIYFLFMAKCPVVARDVGCRVGERILLKRPH